MKKFVYLLLVIAALFTGYNVNAMTESELKDKITKTYIIDGQEVKITASQITELERYLNK